MVLPLIIAGAGMGLNYLGQERGASATRSQLAKEARTEEQLSARRRASIGQALAAMKPEAQLAAAMKESQVYHGQQDTAQAVRAAYGLDNPAIADEMATLGPSINDAAWGRAYGLVDDNNHRALTADAGRQADIDSDQWWWQRFMPNRVERAGDAGKSERMLGTVLQAYGLGATNSAMSRPSSQPGVSSGVNAETGRRMTGDLQDRGWLGLSGTR
jgi:hypothetical protein